MLLGSINGLILNVFAVMQGGGRVYPELMGADAVVTGMRMLLTYRAIAGARRGISRPTDLYFISAILWCLIQGVISMVTVASNIPALQAAGAATTIATLFFACARNYPAPRLAITMYMAIQIPSSMGICFVEDHSLWVFLLQAPMYFVACMALLYRFQALSMGQMQLRVESERDARYDPLTQLFNRAGFAEAVAAVQADGQRPFALFYLDLDGFKAVNDRFGHDAGDQLLADVAARLRANLRSADVLARFGGDEFVILVPDLPEDQAPALAQSLVQRISDPLYPQPEGGEVKIGVSVGFACYPADGTALKPLQLAADTALYEAKRAGKGVWRRAKQAQGLCPWTPLGAARPDPHY